MKKAIRMMNEVKVKFEEIEKNMRNLKDDWIENDLKKYDGFLDGYENLVKESFDLQIRIIQNRK